MKRCTRCGRSFDELIIAVKLDMEVFRIKSTGVPELINNLDQESKEFLCKKCFDEFADIIGKMNIPYKKETLDSPQQSGHNKIETEVVEDVKYKGE
jgi:DNA-directed RNA polymerase subunit RPC12/RpoP